MWEGLLEIQNQSYLFAGIRQEPTSPSSEVTLTWRANGVNRGSLGRRTPRSSGEPLKSATSSCPTYTLCSIGHTQRLNPSWGKSMTQEACRVRQELTWRRKVKLPPLNFVVTYLTIKREKNAQKFSYWILFSCILRTLLGLSEENCVLDFFQDDTWNTLIQ